MDPDQKQARMRNMRRTIEEHNVYRWAASLIIAVSELQPQGEESSRSSLPRSSAA
jgi:trehalose-6-phosphate synthase